VAKGRPRKSNDEKRRGFVFRLTPDALEIAEGQRLKAQATGVLRSISQIVGQEVLEMALYMRLEGRPVEPKQRAHLSLSPAEARALQQIADNWGVDVSSALEVVLRLRAGALTNVYEGPYRLQRKGTKEVG